MGFTLALCGIIAFEFAGIHHGHGIRHITHTEIPCAYITHSTTKTTPKAYINPIFTVFLFFKVLDELFCFSNGYSQCAVFLV